MFLEGDAYRQRRREAVARLTMRRGTREGVDGEAEATSRDKK